MMRTRVRIIRESVDYQLRESVDSLCRDETDAPIAQYECLQTFKRLDSKAFWIAYCVSGVVFYP